MKRIVVLVVVIAAVFGVYKLVLRSGQDAFEEVSVGRVEAILHGLSTGKSMDEQDAIGYWAAGRPIVINEDLYDTFLDFFREKGITYPIKRWEILSSVVVDDGTLRGKSTEVACKIDGRVVTMSVALGNMPVGWAD